MEGEFGTGVEGKAEAATVCDDGIRLRKSYTRAPLRPVVIGGRLAGEGVGVVGRHDSIFLGVAKGFEGGTEAALRHVRSGTGGVESCRVVRMRVVWTRVEAI